ncbi:hypothetical protein DLM_2040 [Aquitalea magnusonii]|uniref:Uncharacterized protein n=1 Tax=Aquitalea magnusonii TaxID=332411 RepID=A0A3G9GJS0_9NEIS|nr:hypothetical protein DLM_2040 [Aquitalea magnusonii]
MTGRHFASSRVIWVVRAIPRQGLAGRQILHPCPHALLLSKSAVARQCGLAACGGKLARFSRSVLHCCFIGAACFAVRGGAFLLCISAFSISIFLDNKIIFSCLWI